MTAFEAAVTMYHREHDRWNQWALFLFGSIAGVFALWNQLSDALPLWVPCIVCAALSAVWVMVAQSIRASTAAWFRTVKRLESNPRGCAFTLFEEELGRSRRLSDLRQTLKLFTWEPWRRVTRMLTLLGVVAFALFLVLAVLSLCNVVASPPKPGG